MSSPDGAPPVSGSDWSLVDTHCHLNAEAFADDQVESLLARARDARVHRVVTIGVDVESSGSAVSLAESHPAIYASVGVDPNDLDGFGAASLNELRDLAQHDRVVAIGEIGLDYHWLRSPRDEQLRAFAQQLDLASEMTLPVVIHSRDADDDTTSVLLDWAAGAAWPDRPVGVMHCFSGDIAMAERLAAAGFLISLAGNVTYPSARRLHEVARGLPNDVLLLETDSPYLAPQARRGRRNEPALVRLTAEYVAELRGESLASIAQATSRNAARLFRWNGAAQ